MMILSMRDRIFFASTIILGNITLNFAIVWIMLKDFLWLSAGGVFFLITVVVYLVWYRDNKKRWQQVFEK